MPYNLSTDDRDGEKMRFLRVAIITISISVLLSGVMGLILAEQSDAYLLEFDEELTSEDYLERGNQLLALGEYSSALTEFGIALVLDPQNADAYRQRGYARFLLSHYTAAEIDTTIALQLNPYDTLALNNRANIYQAQELFEQALADLDRLIDLDREFAPAFNTRGLILFQQSDWAEAVFNFTRALEIDPTMLEAHYNRGLVLFMDYDWAGASSDFKAVINKGADDPLAGSAQHYLDYMNTLKRVPDFLKYMPYDEKLQ